MENQFDAVVVGSGPNGLSAAIAMQQAGLSVLLIEGKEQLGGGVKSEEIFYPGVVHDVCSAVHPMATISPFLKGLPLEQHGLEFLYPEIAAAHPLDDGSAGILYQSLERTIAELGADGEMYRRLIQPIVRDFEYLTPDILSPYRFPSSPFKMLKFGLQAIFSADFTAKRFTTDKAKGLWGGVAAHAIHRLNAPLTSSIGLVLTATAHAAGWPIPKGGAQSLTNALVGYFQSLGGRVQTGWMVRNIDELPKANIIMLDITPKQLLEISGNRLSKLYKWQLKRYKYGMGIFKIDWLLDGPVPFTNEATRRAGTIHLGNTYEEISAGEYISSKGGHPEKPFVLMAQQATIDPSRTHENYYPAWGYCHVPNGSTKDMTLQIENQVERFAPGFRDRILERKITNTAHAQEQNPNYIGGDINGGLIDATQLFTRPVLRSSPYRTSAKGVYICSSSTPPGGGVHGMSGYNAAKRALRDVYNIKI